MPQQYAARGSQRDTGMMSDQEFESFSGLILAAAGMKLTQVKKVMLSVRLSRRMKALDMRSFGQYLKYVESPVGRAEEMTRLLDAVSTNKTEFFREAGHFDYLTRVAVPVLERESAYRRHRGLRVWSAGCSTGEEPYTLAMTLSEHRAANPAFMFSVLATDICMEALGRAARAVYPKAVVESIPPALRRKYLLKGKDAMSGSFRVAPEIRGKVGFRRHNLSEREFGFKEPFDVVFCRNVIIYLERKVQENLFCNFHKSMSPGAYLFVGHSETLDGITDRFVRVAPTIYRRP